MAKPVGVPADDPRVHAKVCRIGDAAGQPARLLGFARDITEKKVLHQKVLQAQKMEAVGQLAGGIAHDFNNLLTVIMGFSELLVHQLPPDSAARRDAEEVLQAGARAATLTRPLFAFSRKQVLQPTALDLNIVVAKMESMLRRLIGDDASRRTAHDSDRAIHAGCHRIGHGPTDASRRLRHARRQR